MTELERYDKVNQSKTLEELAEIIISFADKKGFINGRSRQFVAETMANWCKSFTPSMSHMLTRKYGIRQQAFMLYHHRNRY